MKALKLREKNLEELKKELFALLREQFNLRIQKSSGKQPKANLFKQVRLSIARIKTILKEKGVNV